MRFPYYNENPIPRDAVELKPKLQRKGEISILKKLESIAPVYAEGDPQKIEDYFGMVMGYGEPDVNLYAQTLNGWYTSVYQFVHNRPAPNITQNIVLGLDLQDVASTIWQSMLLADPSYTDSSTPDRKFVSKRFIAYMHGIFMQDPESYLEDYFMMEDDIQALYDDQQKDVSEPWSQFSPTRPMTASAVRTTMVGLGYSPSGTQRSIPSNEFYAIAQQEQADGDCWIVYADDEVMFIDILTDKAACALGSQSWCTVSSGLSQQQKKNGVILLYVVEGGRRMQFDIQGNENKNEDNVEYTEIPSDEELFRPIMEEYGQKIKALVEARIAVTERLTPISDILSGNAEMIRVYDEFEEAVETLKKLRPNAYIGTGKNMKLMPFGYLSIPRNRVFIERIFNNQNLLTKSNFDKLSNYIDKRILKVEFAIRRSPYICKFLQSYPNINWFKDPQRPSVGEITYEGNQKKFNYKAALGTKLNYNMNLFSLADIPGGRHRYQDEYVWIDPIQMMRYEMTHGVYLVIMGFSARGTWSDYDELAKPMVEINWYECCACANQFSKLCGYEGVYVTKNGNFYTPTDASNELAVVWDHDAEGFRLPTEAEWEIASRGGDESRAMQNDDYAGSSNPLEVAWYSENSNRRAHVVGQLKPNGYGLFDMSGNLFEWVWDTPEGQEESYPLQDPNVRKEYESVFGKQNPKRRRRR